MTATVTINVLVAWFVVMTTAWIGEGLEACGTVKTIAVNRGVLPLTSAPMAKVTVRLTLSAKEMASTSALEVALGQTLILKTFLITQISNTIQEIRAV